MSQYVSFPAGDQPDFMLCVKKSNQTLFLTSEIESIGYAVYQLGEDDESEQTLVASATLTVADVMFDELQTPASWTEDETGYNFRYLSPAAVSPFPTEDRTYRVVFTFTPTLASGYAVLTEEFWVSTYPDSAATGYCNRRDLANVFGPRNIETWADLDGDRDARHIAGRISKSIEFATDELHDQLRGGPHTLPLTTVPRIFRDLAARIAGLWLYESRGIQDTDQQPHRLDHHQAYVDRVIAEIRNGWRRPAFVGTPSYGHSAPVVVSERPRR